MSCQAKKIPRPVLVGLLQNQVKKNLSIAISLAITAAVSVYFVHIAPKKAAYIKFHSQDMDELFNQIKDTGVFQSCAPGSK